jgi:hypothetical protein
VSLFKNLRQHITVDASGHSSFNSESFLASFRDDHQVLMRAIVESQAFECFKAMLMAHAGGPFDWWCYTKVKMLRDRCVRAVRVRAVRVTTGGRAAPRPLLADGNGS